MSKYLSPVACIALLTGCATTSNWFGAPQGGHNIVEYGARGDGATLNTDAFAKAIDAASKAGGGTVWVPAGRFVTGAIFLRSNIALHLEPGAVILGSENFDDFPIINGRWEGIERKHYASIINADGAENIAITGRGTIDGRGKVWWDALRQKKFEEVARGRLIGLYRCKNVRIEGVTLMNSPAWTVNPVYCDNVTVDGVTIWNPEDSPNTDGINPDSSTNVHIANCHIDVGDDCITIKSGKDEDGRRVGKPCENITITNCTMLAGHGGVVIGSEMSGGVRNVAITNCIFDGTDNGIRMKTQRGRGGEVQDIRVSNIVMRHVGRALMLNMHYHRLPVEPVSERTPVFRNIHISNITVRDAEQAGKFEGLEEMPLAEIVISDANMHASTGLWMANARDIEFHNCQINTEKGPALYAKNVENLDIDGFQSATPHADAPVIELNNVVNAFIRGCTAVAGTDVFLLARGEKCADILLGDNLLRRAKTPLQKGDDLPDGAVGER